MKFLVSALAAAGAALTLLPSAQAADSQLLTALSTCRATYFDAIAKDKNIPESLKIRDGSRAYLKVGKQPLDVVMFEKPFKDSGLTVTGYVFNDEIIRYVGVPDMHTHFWGLIVKEDWKSVVDKLKGIDWEAVDSRHMSAHANRMLRKNDERNGRPIRTRRITNIRISARRNAPSMCSLMKTRRWFSAACSRPVRLKRRSSLTCVRICSTANRRCLSVKSRS